MQYQASHRSLIDNPSSPLGAFFRIVSAPPLIDIGDRGAAATKKHFVLALTIDCNVASLHYHVEEKKKALREERGNSVTATNRYAGGKEEEGERKTEETAKRKRQKNKPNVLHARTAAAGAHLA